MPFEKCLLLLSGDKLLFEVETFDMRTLYD